jgi:hypothetical protein
MLALPRSVTFAAWTSAWLAGEASLDDVLARVRGSDEPHEVSGLGSRDRVPLTDGLSALRAAGASAMRVVLPQPGRPGELAGPPELTAAAVEAGEAAIAVGAEFALVPQVEAFGPPGDQGHFVVWAWHDASPMRPSLSLADADRALSQTLLGAESALTRLDLPTWQPEIGQLLDDLRTNASAAPLPSAFPARAQTVAARSARIMAIVTYALADDGGAVTSVEAQSRRDALRPLESAAKDALAAAAGALAEPTTPSR